VFERFTDRARRVVVLAQEEARLLNHNYIGTEHVLLGMIHEGEGVAAQALAALGVSLERARAEVEEIIGHGGEAPSGHIPFTPRAKKVLEFSLREAIQLGHNHIGTEHILLGLIREGEGVAAQVLVKLGADLERARATVLELVSSGAAGAAAAREVAREQVAFAEERTRQRMVMRGAGGCMFCGRDLYEVERAVASASGALLCKDCAWLAVQTIERAPEPTAPLAPLRMPPRVFGPAPDDAASADIIELFESWPDRGEELLHHVEGGERLRTVQQAIQERYPPGARPVVTFMVDRLRFLSPDLAAVRFRLSMMPVNAFDGSAVRVGGAWKISRHTFCMIARLAGVQCPEDAGDDDDAA
jgi:ClpA/ClpB-like protein